MMRRLRLLLLATAIAAFVFFPTTALATDANGNHDSYIWVVGATTPGATAMDANGSTITIKGNGTLMAGPGNTATGGGSYAMSSGGSGTFAVTGVQGFVSYGSTPGFPIPGATGGETKLDITLSNGATGVLTVICLLGSPPAGKEEGIMVVLGKDGQFTKSAGGNTVFIHT